MRRISARSASSWHLGYLVVLVATVLPGCASQVAPVDRAVPRHVETWAYDDECNGGEGASATVVRQWLTYAESACGPQPNGNKVTSDCRSGTTTYCTSIAYLDTNRIYPDNPLAESGAAQENWWLHQPGHTDASHRLACPCIDDKTAYLLNQGTGAARTWFQSYARTNFDSFDGLMMDDTGAGLAQQLFGTGFGTSNEISTDEGIQAEHRQMASAMTHASGEPFEQIDNGQSVNPYEPTSFPLLNDPASVTGLIAEGIPWQGNGSPPMTSYYATLLDDMAYVDDQANNFLVLLSYDKSTSPTEDQARRIQQASVMLGYNPGHVVDWADLEQDNANLAVWPEEGIYPTQPVQSMGSPGGSGCLESSGTPSGGVSCSSGGHNDLKVSAGSSDEDGVFRREFRSCNYRGSPIGACAAVVNDTASAVTVSRAWLTQSYRSTITWSGGDVQSGGSLKLEGAPFVAGETEVPPHDAILLRQRPRFVAH